MPLAQLLISSSERMSALVEILGEGQKRIRNKSSFSNLTARSSNSRYFGSPDKEVGSAGIRRWLSIPEVRGLEKDLRKVAWCEGGITLKRWVFRNSKIPERLSSLEMRVAELGGAGNNSSRCSINTDEASVVCVGVIERGWVRGDSMKWATMSRLRIVRRSDREAGDKDDRISERETTLVDFLNMWPYPTRSWCENYGTSISIAQQFLSTVSETSVFPL